MPANIKKNSVRSLDLHLINDEYWDFMLYRGECYGNASGLDTECLSSYIDASNADCWDERGRLYSTVVWSGAVNSGITLKDIGITGVDNGFIHYDKDAITPGEFLNLYTKSNYDTHLDGLKFFVSPVTGNTGRYSYPTELVKEVSGDTYVKLTGGFYQGFFKLEGFDYQTLPTKLEDDWHFEFTIRKRNDYQAAENAVNKTHPENAGIFFYIGTRAENKFSEIYNGIYDNKESFAKSGCSPIYSTYEVEDELGDYVKNDDTDLINAKIETSDGHSSEEQGYSEIKTNNKFIFFDRTPTGFTTENWDDEYQVVLGDWNRKYIDNPYLLYSRALSGYTTKDYEKITVPSGNGYDSEGKYNNIKDIIGNAFALMVNEDGSIGYRYTIKDCDSESGYTTISESSLSGLVKDNEWATINLKVHQLDKEKMKLYIYLNGYLIFISKELPVFNFRALNDVETKQEGVPYNISLGGGTQGLAERIWLNYFDISDKVYDIEKNYAGTFIGDFKSFKMYTCEMNLEQIKANNKFEKSLL